jgi:3-hydroxybutyryl-CoA dehydrogenase
VALLTGGEVIMNLSFDVPDKFADHLETLSEQLGISRSTLLTRLLEMSSEDLIIQQKLKLQTGACGKTVDLKRVGVFGCQAIARGLAKLLAVKGISVIVVDESEEELKQAIDLMTLNLDWMISKWELTETEKKLVLQYIKISTNPEDLIDIDLLFETFRGPKEERKQHYRKLSQIIPENVIVAIDDDTSLISQVASYFTNPSRVIGFHLTYPSSRRKVVEIMRGRHTSDDTVQKMAYVADVLNKDVIGVLESAGAITTRVIMPMINEAIGLWTEGVASAEDIDKALQLAMNLPMGPLEYADTFGLDTVLNTLESLFRSHGLQQFRPQARLKHLVRMGFLGKKSGRGIHSYEHSEIGEVP